MVSFTEQTIKLVGHNLKVRGHYKLILVISNMVQLATFDITVFQLEIKGRSALCRKSQKSTTCVMQTFMILEKNKRYKPWVTLCIKQLLRFLK